MKTMSSTEARENFFGIISDVQKEPVSILKKNKNVVVVTSSHRYKELKKMEDILYGKAAELAIKEGFASQQETDDLLSSL